MQKALTMLRLCGKIKKLVAKMPPDRWTKVNQLFYAALEKPPEERNDFLTEQCAEDLQLRKEVESLLAAHQKGGEFIQNPVDPISFLTEPQDTLTTGQQIGSYKIVKEIGRGGMGSVYLATRADELFNKQVAIKVIKRGMDTDDVLRHFSNERRILGNFDHPNIAHLLDGGSTDNGLPYFVMDYVEGKSIDEYCDERCLSITERLELFQQVCAAVSYAHRNLVVHRDLKPSNIVITNEGVPKLLDFGIAKILQSESAERSTATGILLMTPEYASPEQAQGLPVTTLSDVYSLGVILYELLTGHDPYRLKNRSSIEISRTISETQPHAPSTVVDSDVSKTREGTRERLQKRLRGDLDNIVLMALRKESERRYQSVDQFSEDIHCHLNGLPVLASRDTLGYRTLKFIKRNKMEVGAVFLICLSLLGGIIVSSWQARRAHTQEQIAKLEQARAERRFNDLRKFAHSVLFDYHDAIKDLPGSTPVRARLVKDALQYLDSLSKEENTNHALKLELAAAYEKVGDVQGGTMEANLGDTNGAIASYRKALKIREELLASNPKDFQIRSDTAYDNRRIGLLLWETGDIDGAMNLNKKALELFQGLADENKKDFESCYQLGASHGYVASISLDKNDLEDALEHLNKDKEILTSCPDQDRHQERLHRAVSVCYEHIGSVYLQLNDFEKAFENNRKALELRAALTSDFPLNADYRRTLVVSYYNQGEILNNMGRIQEALESYQKDIALTQELLKTDPANESYRGDFAYGLIRIGDMLSKLGKNSEALSNYKQSKESRSQDVKADPDNLWKRSSLIEAYAKTSKMLALSGDQNAAENECQNTFDLMKSSKVEPTSGAIRSFFADTYKDLGDVYEILETQAPLITDRTKWNREECDMYSRSLEIWHDLQQRKMLSPLDEKKPALVAVEVAKCEARTIAHNKEKH